MVQLCIGTVASNPVISFLLKSKCYVGHSSNQGTNHVHFKTIHKYTLCSIIHQPHSQASYLLFTFSIAITQKQKGVKNGPIPLCIIVNAKGK